MDKITTQLETDDYGPTCRFIDLKSNASMMKLAHDVYIPPAIEEAIDKFKKTASSDVAYLYNRAVGAGEFYGDNRNGDYFFDQDLPQCHGSFVKNAHWFRHHINKNPETAIGRPVASAYNDKMHSIDLIIAGPIEKISFELESLERGDMILTSMGAKVPYDVCSICGHKSTNVSQYCGHLKTAMRQTLPDGQRVCAYNPKPKFFDISTVVVPAGDESAIFMKVASRKLYVVPSAYVARDEGVNFHDKVADEKIAVIIKRIPGEISGGESTRLNDDMMRRLPELENYEDQLPTGVLDRLSNFNMRDVFGSTKSLGIVLSPEEFQYIVLRKAGRPGLARRLQGSGVTFKRPSVREVTSLRCNPIHGTINDEAIEVLSSFIPSRSGFSPFIQERLLNLHQGHIKAAKVIEPQSNITQDLSAINIAGTLAGLAGLYSLYRHKYPSDFVNQSMFVEFVKRHPYISSFLAAGSLWKLHDIWKQERGLSKTAEAGPTTRLVGPAAGTYLAAGYLKNKLDQGEIDPDSIKGKLAQGIANNPGKLAIGASALAMFGKKIPWKNLKKYRLTKTGAVELKDLARHQLTGGQKKIKSKKKKKGLIPLSSFRSGVEGLIFPLTMGSKRLATNVPIQTAEWIATNKLLGG